MAQNLLGPALIALGAILWATDTPFRYPAISRLDPAVIVLIEHFLGLLLLGAWILIRRRKEALSLKAGEWLGVLFVGAASSALATVLFTASFKYVNPSVTILLQKLQPIAVVLIAAAVLKERPERRFYPWAAVALVAAVLLSAPKLTFHEIWRLDIQSRGVIYALLAAGIWAVGTVIGKILLNRQPSDVVTFWRFAFGLATLFTMLSLGGTSWGFIGTIAGSPSLLKSLLYLSMIPGLLAMLLYYAGLSRTPASVATFIELLYPVSAVLLNTWILKMPLTPVQAVAGTVLLFAVSQISR